MMLSERDRLNILRAIRKLVLDKHINVANLDQDYANWAALLDQCRRDLARAEDIQEFENGVRKILAALGSSHTAFFHASGGDVPPASNLPPASDVRRIPVFRADRLGRRPRTSLGAA